MKLKTGDLADLFFLIIREIAKKLDNKENRLFDKFNSFIWFCKIFIFRVLVYVYFLHIKQI